MSTTTNRTLVRSSRTLAETLGVNKSTVQQWRKRGILAPATVVDHGRIIVYDLDKVFECLQTHRAKPGRPKSTNK